MKKRPSKKAYIKIPHRVLDSNKYRRLTPASRVLYTGLVRLHSWYCHSGNGQTFEQRDWQLVLETGMDEKTVRRSRKELIKEGYIKTERNGRKNPTTYTINYPME